MKLLIDNDMEWSVDLTKYTPEVTEDVFEMLQEMRALAKRFSIRASFEIAHPNPRVRIYIQKVCLDDLAMNELFSDLLTDLFEFNISYAFLGGAGIQFSMRLEGAKPRAARTGWELASTEPTLDPELNP